MKRSIDSAYKKIYSKYTSSGKIPKTVRLSPKTARLSLGKWIDMVDLRETFPEKEKKHCQRLSFDRKHLNTFEHI